MLYCHHKVVSAGQTLRQRKSKAKQVTPTGKSTRDWGRVSSPLSGC